MCSVEKGKLLFVVKDKYLSILQRIEELKKRNAG